MSDEKNVIVVVSGTEMSEDELRKRFVDAFDERGEEAPILIITDDRSACMADAMAELWGEGGLGKS